MLRKLRWRGSITIVGLLSLMALAAPIAVAEDQDGLALAVRRANEGGLTTYTVLRVMLWNEPPETASFAPLRPTPAEETQLAEAERIAKVSVSAGANLQSALVLLGRIAWIAGRSAEAADYYQRALTFAPDSAQALLGLTDLQLDRRDRAKAQTYLGMIRTDDRETANEVGLRQAVLALWRGDGAQALSILMALEPPAGEAGLPYRWLLAKSYALSGNSLASWAILGAEAPLGVRGIWAENEAIALQALGAEDDGQTALSRASAAWPAYPLPRWEKALALLDRSDAAGAISALSGDTQSAGGFVTGYLYLLACAREEAKDYIGAAKAFSELIAKRPRLGLAYCGLSRVYFMMKRNEDALRYAGLGLKVHPKLACLYLQRAEIYDRLKMKKQAAADRQTASSLGTVQEIKGLRLQIQSISDPRLTLTALVGVSGGEAPPRGLFISRDGRIWRWHPWHSVPVALARSAAGQTIYVLPDLTDENGAVLSGVVPPPYQRDDRPPTFTKPIAVERKNHGFIASWATDEPTRAEVLVWPRGSRESSAVKIDLPEYTLWHQADLGELFPREYNLRVTVYDAAGNSAAAEPISFRHDETVYGLSGQFSINNGAPRTNDELVTLNLSLDRAGPGTFLRIANEDGQFSGWLPFVPVMNWELSYGDGEKTVSVQFKRGDDYSPVYTANVILDTRPPIIYGLLTPVVNETGAYLTWRTDEPASVRLDLRKGGTWVTIHLTPDYLQEHAASLTGLEPGTRYELRIIATDQAGNISETTSQIATISAVDRTPPTGNLQIEGGARYTRSIYVTLSIAGYDNESGLREMSFSNDGYVWSMPEPYAPTKTWRLNPGDGPKTVYLRLVDGAGNVSAAIQAQIDLDATPPSIYGISAQILPDGRVYFHWQTDEPTYGLVQTGRGPILDQPDRGDFSGTGLSREHHLTTQPLGSSGTIYYRIAACDQAGNISLAPPGTLAARPPDATGPTGGITINGGESVTRSPQVILTIWAQDSGGIAAMQLRNADSPWWSWEPYATRRNWTLSAGDGEKEVQIRFRDALGNESPVYSARIALDTKPPVVRDLVCLQTGPTAMVVKWRTDEPSRGTVYYRRLSGGAEYQKSEEREYSPSYEHQVILDRLEPGATYRARLVVQDRAGNQYETPGFDLVLKAQDQTPPSGSVKINNGAEYTKDVRVTLSLTADDRGGGSVAAMSFSNDGRNWSPEEPYQTMRSYTLPGGDGQKTVYVRFKDRAGNWSAPASDGIILDTQAPRVTNEAWTQVGFDAVEITWRTDEPSFGIVRYGTSSRSYGESGAEDRGSLPGGYSLEHRVRITRLQPGRTYSAAIEAVDRAENRTTTPEFTFGLRDSDQTPPSGSVKINNGAEYTRDVRVTLSLSADDRGGGSVAAMSFSNDGRNWSPEEPYLTTRSYTLPGGDGQKTVYVRFKDRAGNWSAPASDGIILDTQKPAISGITVKVVDHRTVRISWRTSEPTWGEVRYGRDGKNLNSVARTRGANQGGTAPSGSFSTEHTVELKDLIPGWNYYFIITAYDRAGNSASSQLGSIDLKENKPTAYPGFAGMATEHDNGLLPAPVNFEVWLEDYRLARRRGN